MLSLNPALAHADLSPRESPLPFKTGPDPSSSASPGADPKRPPGPEPPSWGEERPADVHSPPLPQPNIGKLVGADDLSPPPVTACKAVENGCPGSPPPDGLRRETGSPEETAASAGAADSAAAHFTFELGSGREQSRSEETRPSAEPTAQNGVGLKEESSAVAPQDAGPETQSPDCREEQGGGAAQPGPGAGLEQNGVPSDRNAAEEKESTRGLEGQIEQLLRINSLPNGLEQERGGGSKPEEEGDGEEGGFSPSPVPSKEDSVTEEKEMEESKQESSEGGAAGSGSIQPKLNNSRLQPVSVPYGGARPKQPVSLKLQIPQPLSGQVQNQLAPAAPSKNKNLENQSWREVAPVWVPDSQAPVCMKCDVKFTFTKRRHHCRACGKVFCAACCGLKCRLVYMDRKEARVCVTCHATQAPASNQSPNPNNPAEYCSTIPPLQQAQASGALSSPPPTVMVPVGVLKQPGNEGSLTREQRRVWFADGVLPNGDATDSPKPPGSSPASSQSLAISTLLRFLLPLCSNSVKLNNAATETTPTRNAIILKFRGTRSDKQMCLEILFCLSGASPFSFPAVPVEIPVKSCFLHQIPVISPVLVLVKTCYLEKNITAESRLTPPPPPPLHPQAAHAPVAPVGSPVGSSLSLIPEDGLPPILISTGVKGDYAVEERPSEIVLMQQLEEGGPDPLVFVLNANLLAMVKLVNYVNRKCWYVTTKGMHAVGQAEVVVLLQCLPDEKTVPKDIFSHFVQLYQEALSGDHLSHSFFTQSFLGSREHGGFLYISPSFQSLQDLLLPNPPFLFGVLIQKWETPWAKVFPIRLMLRLGAEYRFYPCPLFSVRFRKPLFGETGHTIMNLLADFRNYQYTLPVVKGLVVDMEVRKTSIKIPSNRYSELMKAMNKSNEHVLAMGACFNDRADSHLVCVQNDDGNYQTQAISIHHQPRKVTGACFFVFSGALKASSGFLAKTSIVEDGVMIQITAETMDSLRQALRDMKDFTITCGKADQEENQELVHIQWTEDDHNFNKGVISPIDGKSMESITSVKIFHGSEFKANGKVIRWTEVFFLQSDDQPSGLSDPADHSRLTENVARAFCVALCPHLKLLKEDGMAKLGLRVTLDSDQVGYLAGSNGQPLLPQYLSDLDSALIPVIHGGACQLSEGPVVMELVFYILEIIS
uniref:Zinc finger, FYVE domain containing 9a n=1 Tax=Salarias fasciatus TaxID=181472 RepID=A0A672HMH9_SALFA